MTWTNPRLGRVDDAEERCTCALLPHPHQARYRFERVDERGNVDRQYLCTNRAAQRALDHGIVFPPGPWEDG